MGRAQGVWSRRRIMQAVCCGASLGLSGWVGAQGLPSSDDSRKNAWLAAQQAINDARGMADRITTSLDGLTSTAATAVATKEKLLVELRRLSDQIATLTADRDRLLEEYRNGLFCSGCNKTKSEILAKGETFPHSGQQIIRPTQAQIDAKAQELQAPIDRAEREVVAGRKTVADATAKADAAFDQIRAGVVLWRTAISYWRGSVHKGLRERDEQLKTTLNEYQTALQAELQRQVARRGRASDAEVQAEADVWQRLLDKHKDEIAQFRTQSHKASVELIERSGTQKTTIDGYLHKGLLPKSLLAVVVVDAQVSTGTAPHALGLNYHLGQLPPTTGPNAGAPWQPLPAVAAFISDFKSAGLPDAAMPAMVSPSPAATMPAQVPSPPSVPSRAPSGNSRLLNTLP